MTTLFRVVTAFEIDHDRETHPVYSSSAQIYGMIKMVANPVKSLRLNR